MSSSESSYLATSAIYLGTSAVSFYFSPDKDGSIDSIRTLYKSFGLVADTENTITSLILTL